MGEAGLGDLCDMWKGPYLYDSDESGRFRLMNDEMCLYNDVGVRSCVQGHELWWKPPSVDAVIWVSHSSRYDTILERQVSGVSTRVQASPEVRSDIVELGKNGE